MSHEQERRCAPISLEDVLQNWLPTRLSAIDSFLWALEMLESHDPNIEVEVAIGTERKYSVPLGVLAAPLIDAGYVHSRALLEFLGVGARKGKLVQIEKRNTTDIAIENFAAGGTQLVRLEPVDAYAAINMPQSVVEWALVHVIEMANKYVAHVTSGEVLQMAMYHQVRIAVEGITQLLHSHLYVKMGLMAEHGPINDEVYACNYRCSSQEARCNDVKTVEEQ